MVHELGQPASTVGECSIHFDKPGNDLELDGFEAVADVLKRKIIMN